MADATADKRFPLTTERIRAIASNTFREAVRNRAFIGLMVLALIFLVLSVVMAAIAVPGQAARILLSFGFASISLFGVVIAIVMGVILVYKEIEKKTIYTIVPKAVHRFEVIVGKYVGMLCILLVEIGVLAAVWLFILAVEGVSPSWDIAKALSLVFMEVMLVTAVAVVFSSFSTPILSGLFTLGIFLLGRVSSSLGEMAQASEGVLHDLKPILRVLSAIVPDLKVFDGSQEVLLGITISPAYLLGAFGYCLSFVGVLLALAVLLFQRRDFV